MSARRRRPGTVALVKDLILFAAGLALIFGEAFLVKPQDFNPYVLGLGAALVGVPGSLQLLAPRTGGRRTSGEPGRSRPRSPSSSSGPGADR